MPRRPFGTVYRRTRTGRTKDGTKRTGYHPGWYVRYRRNGKEVTRYAGRSRAEAEAYLDRRRQRVERQEVLGDPGVTEISFEEYAEEYLTFSRREHSPSTSRTRQRLVEGKLIPFFGDRLVVDITPRDIEKLLTQNEGLSPATRNRILSALSAMLDRALRLGYLNRNPARAFKRAREHVTPLPLVSLADQKRLLDALPNDRRLLFLMALDTGGETRRASPRRVERHRPQGELGPASPDQESDPAYGSALEPVAARPGEDGGVPPWGGVGSAVCAGCGQRHQPALVVAALLQESCRSHRATQTEDPRPSSLAAINLVRAGVDLPTVQAHLGHRHLVSTLRYAAYADETASARAARALDRVYGEDGTEGAG